MELEIVFRGTEPSQAMEAYVIKYGQKFKKYLGQQDENSVFLHVVLEGHHNHHMYMVEVRLKSQQFDLVVQREGKDMYPLIDETMHVMEQELSKAKRKNVDSVKQRKKCC